jgi:hypothetical protein
MRTKAAHTAAPGRDTVLRRTPDDVDESVILRNNIFCGRAAVPHGGVLGANGVLALQRSTGNRATGQLLSRLRAPKITAQRDDKDAPTVASPRRRRRELLPAQSWLTPPEEFLRDKPSLAPKGGLPLLPSSQVDGLIDWRDLGTAYRDRRLVLEPRDRAVIVAHWQLWYPLAQALYKIPGASLKFDNPAGLMNWMSAKMIDSSLAGDNPNVVELLDREAGVDTSVFSLYSIKFGGGSKPVHHR